MLTVFETSEDVRVALLELRHLTSFTWSQIANAVGLKVSQLHQCVDGNAKIPLKDTQGLAEFCKAVESMQHEKKEHTTRRMLRPVDDGRPSLYAAIKEKYGTQPKTLRQLGILP